MTTRTRYKSAIVFDGSPSRMTKSANKPAFTRPRSARWKASALIDVAERNTSSGFMP